MLLKSRADRAANYLAMCTGMFQMKFFGLLSEKEVGMLNYAFVKDNSRYCLTGNHIIRNIVYHSNGNTYTLFYAISLSLRSQP